MSLVKSLVVPAGVDLEHELLAFRSHFALRADVQVANWDARFELWIKRARSPRLRLVEPPQPPPPLRTTTAEEASRELREVLAATSPELLRAVEREGGA